MKASVWNILSVAFLIGTVFLVILFGLIFLMPNQILPVAMRPVNVPDKLLLPTATETAFQFPPTWTKSPKPATATNTLEPPTATPEVTKTDTPQPSNLPGTATDFVLPSESLTNTDTPTLTRTNTRTFNPSVVIIVNGTAKTVTKTKKPSKTPTASATITPGGPTSPPAFLAIDDIVTVDQYPASVQIYPLVNDMNITGTELHIVSVSKGPYHGNVEIYSRDMILYSPNEGYTGDDAFYYKMTNVGGLTSFAWVHIYVFSGSNATPTDISLSGNTVAENGHKGDLIGTFTTTDDGPTPYHYSLVSGTGSADNGSFAVSDDGTLTANAIFNKEEKSTYSIRVRSVDSGGRFFEKQFTITITNVNEPPNFTTGGTWGVLSNTDVTRNIIALDPDVGDTAALTWVQESSPALPGTITVTGLGTNTINLTGKFPDPSFGASYIFTVTATDGSGLTAVQTFTINVTQGPP
jgi:hypothetical protein